LYQLPHFKAHSEQDVLDFMKEHPFATLIGASGSGSPVATQVPLLTEMRNGQLFLQGHIMRGQIHTRAFEENDQVLALFTGAHSYISASWYSQPQTASTWNYLTVQARGTMVFQSPEWLHQLLIRLTAAFEKDPDSPALVEKMPDAYIQKMLPAIIGFEIEVQHLDHVFKLSQNRDAASLENIIAQLSSSHAGDQEMAREMIAYYAKAK
jgi:transcriptional regulator